MAQWSLLFEVPTIWGKGIAVRFLIKCKERAFGERVFLCYTGL